jgi:hypothetical protein
MSRLTEFITTMDNGMSEHFRRSDRKSMYEIWNMVVEKARESVKIKWMHHYERHEDMSSTGRVQVFLEEDGDVILTIIPDIEDRNQMPLSVQFCTQGSGGGKSPNVRKALLDLALAIEEDNILNPMHRIK